MTQEETLNILKTGANVFLTGEPGSGKTHTINRYTRWLSERGVAAAITASTGIAATHIGGMTIHSWSGVGIRKRLTDEDIEYVLSKEKIAKRILDAKVLIIDEISMLDADLLEDVERVMRYMRRAPLTEGQPFGGVQVVFVGDFFQLPPVNKTEERVRFAFESAAWKAANPIICYLHEQHRQEDSDFLELLGAMRRGELSQEHRTILTSRSSDDTVSLRPVRARGNSIVTTARSADNIVPASTHRAQRDDVAGASGVITKLYTHNADVDRINHESLEALSGKLRVYHMSSHGAANLVETLKKGCISPETLSLKPDAAVMFTRNNPDKGYANGTLGIVVDFTPLGAPVVRTRGGSLITVEAVEWVIQDGNKILARISQLPLRLAWAITVHKSQGMSLDAAIIDLGKAFEYGQGYVALSRLRTLDGLYLEGLNERALQMHPQVVSYDDYARRYSDAAAKKFASISEPDRAAMYINFLRAIGGKNIGV